MMHDTCAPLSINDTGPGMTSPITSDCISSAFAFNGFFVVIAQFKDTCLSQWATIENCKLVSPS